MKSIWRIPSLSVKLSNHYSITVAGFRRYVANTSWLLLERVLRIGVVLLINVYLARYLGPGGYGLISYATSIAGIFLVLSNLGLNDILVKELKEESKQQGIILGTGFLLIALGSLAAFTGIATTSFFIDDKTSSLLILIISVGALFRTSCIFEYYFQARVEGKYISIANVSQLLLSAILKLGLIWIQAPLHWFAWAFMLDYSLLFVMLTIAFLYTGNSWRGWKIDLQQARKYLKLAWPLLLSGVFITIYMRIDQIMIKHFIDSQSVGHYSVAVQISEAWYFIPMLISASLFPSILDMRKNNDAIYYRRLQALYRLMCGIGFAAAIVASFLSEWMILVLFGPDYVPAAPVLQIHIWAGVFVSLGVASGKSFIAENLNRHIFYRTFWGCILNLLLNILFIPLWGIQGAAVATLFSHGFSAFFYDAINPTTRVTFIMKIKALLFPIPVRI